MVPGRANRAGRLWDGLFGAEFGNMGVHGCETGQGVGGEEGFDVWWEGWETGSCHCGTEENCDRNGFVAAGGRLVEDIAT